jgi:endonuclease/exonuclease/phosphatase family metal-dependent hydrolase
VLSPLPAPPCASAGDAVAWVGPGSPADRGPLSERCAAVGPAVVRSPRSPRSLARVNATDASSPRLAVVTWNLHEGRGALAEMIQSLAPSDVIVLAQEAVRGDADRDITTIAEALGLWLAYVPSMPNGRGRHQDRGCAILSTLPLAEPIAIELPWAYQRRVAVMATVAVGDSQATLRVVSVHLDNRTGRRTQASALAAWLQPLAAAGERIIVGGDLNTWFGAGEAAARAIDRVVPRIACGGGATFRFGRRLDHLFATPGVPVRACHVAGEAYGSDHHPIVAALR